MTREEAIAIIENEKKCVNRANKNDYCNRDCYNCELVKTDTEILTALDMAIKALQEQAIPEMYYPQVDGITPTVVAQADGEKTCGTCRNEDTYHCAECENKSDYEQSQADGEYILKKDVMGCIGQTSVHWELARKLRKLPSVAIPSADPKTGHWIEHPEIETSTPEYLMFYECSECGDKQCFCKSDIHKKHFCNNCGAKMVEPQENCDTCKHKDDGWDSEHCDGCCGNHSGFEPQERSE